MQNITHLKGDISRQSLYLFIYETACYKFNLMEDCPFTMRGSEPMPSFWPSLFNTQMYFVFNKTSLFYVFRTLTNAPLSYGTILNHTTIGFQFHCNAVAALRRQVKSLVLRQVKPHTIKATPIRQFNSLAFSHSSE